MLGLLAMIVSSLVVTIAITILAHLPLLVALLLIAFGALIATLADALCIVAAA